MRFRKVLCIETGGKKLTMLYGCRKIKGVLVKAYDEVSLDVKGMNDDQVVFEIMNFIDKNKILARDILFTIECSNVVFRNIRIPIISERNIKQSIEWQIRKYINDGYEKYYIDYQIIRKMKGRDEEYYDIIAALIPKEVIERYVLISEKLNTNLLKIDIWPNSFSRAFKGIMSSRKTDNCVAIMTFDKYESSITILQNGNLAFHKYIDYHIDDELTSKSLNRILGFFMNVYKFYSDNNKESINSIYTSSFCENYSYINEYITNYFSIPAYSINDLIGNKYLVHVKSPEMVLNYLNVLGMLL